MTLEEFIRYKEKPKDLSPLLEALWYDLNDDWQTAHQLTQNIHSKDGSWVHAYLHRKEGDVSNATYWYRRAEKQVVEGSLKKEWETIVRTLLQH